MPALPGFSDNPFLTHADLVTASHSLLVPLHTYKSPGGGRIKIPVETGTHFDEIAAQLEGFARSLWVAAPLIALQNSAPSPDQNERDAHLRTFPRGLIAGTTPELRDEYWGDVQDTDQRMVEMEILSFALLSAPEDFLPDSVTARKHLITWLQGINGKAIPTTNWLWFRVLTNLALVKTCGVPYDSLRESIAADLAILDSFEMGEGNGWNSDGIWGEGGRQADYYSGSFAIQFSQLLFVKFASDLDSERAEKYRKRAGLFALDFMRYFDADGASIPFGRSLTYRFAMGAFWSVVAYAEVELPHPLSQGVVKGFLLRHLRYWAAKSAIFHADGTLNIGYAFPNMYMSEDYNSPQSVYWCLKTLISVGLPPSHAFWTCEELPHPLYFPNSELEVKEIKPPLQIVCNSNNHTFLLSSGQFCGWPLKATEAKYCKFAYSSAFAFSVPTGTLIQQMAPDSTLALSNDDGETWRVRWKSSHAGNGGLLYMSSDGNEQKIPTLVSTWKPWKLYDINVETTLIPPTKRWPDWHIRVHRIRFPALKHSITTMEGGFAIFGRQRESGLGLVELDFQHGDGKNKTQTEGRYESDGAALVVSRAGASGIRDLATSVESKGVVLKPDSNTNLLEQRTLIPMLRNELGKEEIIRENEYILVTGVFAVVAQHGVLDMSLEDLKLRWDDKPVILRPGDAVVAGEDYISL